jgi:hypothetical protein
MFGFLKKAAKFVWKHRAGVGTIVGWFVGPTIEKKIKELK